MIARAPRLLLFVFLSSFLAAGGLARRPRSPPSVASSASSAMRAGRSCPGPACVLESRATGAQLETTSQSDGAFIFPQVRPGLYTVKVELGGFKPVTYNDVKVDAGQEYSLTRGAGSRRAERSGAGHGRRRSRRTRRRRK